MLARNLVSVLTVCLALVSGTATATAGELPPIAAIQLRDLPALETVAATDLDAEPLLDVFGAEIDGDSRVAGRAWRIGGGAVVGVIIATPRRSVARRILDEARDDTGRDGQALAGAPETLMFRGVSVDGRSADVMIVTRGGSAALFLVAPPKLLADEALVGIARAQHARLPAEVVSEGFVSWLPGSRASQGVGAALLLVGFLGVRRFLAGGSRRTPAAAARPLPSPTAPPVDAPPSAGGVPWDRSPLD